MRILLVVLSVLFLASCKTTAVMDQTKYVTIEIPETLYESCPDIKTPPNWETLTNQQVINYIDHLYRVASACKISVNAIKAYEQEAKARIENGI